MNATESEFRTLLYVSTLAPTALISDVARIANTSRVRNCQDAITGLLVFDGCNFAQLVEGPHQAVAALLARLAVDKRHADMEVLIFGPLDGKRRFPGWDLGYHFASDGGDELTILSGLRGAEALACFELVRLRVDRLAQSAKPTP